MHGFTVAGAAGGPEEDRALERLLHRVYVDEGYTDRALAPAVFAPAAVRSRGELLVARDAGGALLGTVIVVPPSSPMRRLAAPDEAEMHLLAVAPEGRGRGVGAALVDAAVALARGRGLVRMVLWTQREMLAAQRLYARAGFAREPARDFEARGRAFLVYARPLG